MGNKPARDYTLPIETVTATYSHTFRIVLLGPAKVGKTALVCRLTRKPFPELYDPTIEDGFREQIEVDGNNVLMDIITAGEPAAMLDQYMRTGEGFILVYSVTDKQSFESCTDFYKRILRARDADSVPFVFVGNKSDSPERVVSVAEGEELAKQNGWIFFETSAKHGILVDEIFREISRRVISSQQPTHK